MSTKKKKLITQRELFTPVQLKLPFMIKVGKHYINPEDVSAITQVKDSLYVVSFVSNPNPEYKCWIQKNDIAALLEHFDVKVSE